MSIHDIGLPEGIYRGLSYTDESPIQHGEYELLVRSDVLAARMATGLTIQEEEIPVSRLSRMETGRVSQLFQDGTNSQMDASSGKIIGIAIDDNPFLLFTPGALEVKGMSGFLRQKLKGDVAALLAFTLDPSWGVPPAQLFGPTEAQHNTFSSIVEELLSSGNFFPQLKHGGRMPPEYYSR